MSVTIALIATLLVLMTEAAPPQFLLPALRECTQGHKLFNLVLIRDTPPDVNFKSDFLLPRCIPFEHKECTRGCEWIPHDDEGKGCELHPKFQTNPQNIYLAGARVVPDQNGKNRLDSFCCESLLHEWAEGCMPQEVLVTSWSWPLALKDEIVQKVVLEGSTPGADAKVTAFVCRVTGERINSVCRNPHEGDVDFEAPA